MKTFAIGLTAAALVFGGAACAAPGTPQGKHSADADGNGVITRAEATAKANAMFTRLDVNKDGTLDKSDRVAMREMMKTRMFERLDANKDGSITKTEFLAERDGHDASGRGGRGGKPHGRHGGGRMMAGMMKDGALTQPQFVAAALQRFDATDTNKDGQLTKDERQAAREQMKAKWQQMRAQKAQG